MAHSLSGTNRRFDYAYNAVNDITSVQRDGNVNDSDGYEYDLTQQILKFHQNGHLDSSTGMVMNPQHDNTMSFDGCGNRTNVNNVPQTYNTMNQPDGIPHDDDGDVQMYNGFTYTYDAQNRLRRAESATVTEDFYYDGLNRQVARVTNGGTSTPTPTPTPTATPISTPPLTRTPTIPPLPTITPTPTIPPLGTPTATPTIPPLGSPTPTPTPTAAPKCSPVNISQSFNNASGHWFVSMSCPNPTDATIFYTTDGSTPTHSGGTATGTTQTYSSQIDIGNCGDHPFKAIAYKAGWLDSDVSSQDYDHGTCGGGGFGPMTAQSSTQSIVFSVWDGAWALLEEYDANGNRIEAYLQGYHGLVKTLVANVYYYQDELGSTSHIASVSGALLMRQPMAGNASSHSKNDSKLAPRYLRST